MLITALVVLGMVMLAVSMLVLSWSFDRSVALMALLLAALAITQACLAYLWKCDALEWEIAYERDIRQSDTQFQLQTQSRQRIRIQSPKICFGDQFPAELIPFVRKRSCF